MSRTTAWLVACGLCLAGSCADPEPYVPSPPALPRSQAFWERMALFMDGSGSARLRGFDGALPEGWTVEVRAQDAVVSRASASADVHGRFDLRFNASEGQAFEVLVAGAGVQVPAMVFHARARASAFQYLLRPRLAGTGSTPNQVLFADDAPLTGAGTALVVLSGDNALDNADADRGLRLWPFVELPPSQSGVAANPWSAAARGGVAWVSRYAHGGVTAVQVESGRVLGQVEVSAPVTLPSSLTLNPPVDADGDGDADTVVTALLPRTPTGVARVGNHLLVAYANVLSTGAGAPAQFAPGMLARLDLHEDGNLQGQPRFLILPGANAQHVVSLNDQRRVAVACTGALQRDVNGWRVDSDGFIHVVDTQTMTVERSIPMQRFGPSKPVLLPGGEDLYVPSVLRAELARVDVRSGSVTRGPGAAAAALRLHGSGQLTTVFECALHPTGLVLCPVFDADVMVVVDPRADEVKPWPFVDDLPLVETVSAVRHGPQSLAIRPGRNGVDRTGNDVVVLMGLASRLVGLDTRFVLGP